MKKILSFVLLALLLFGACARNVQDIPADDIAQEIRQSLSLSGDCAPADADFFELNFSGAPAPKSYAVYLSDTAPMWEYGVFCMETTADAAKMLTAVKEYLASEAEAKASLAALYPSETASAESAYYHNAQSATAGTVVYYFAGDEANAKVAKSTFETASGK